jgi:chromatin-remodeling ATPase INO80
LNQVQLNRLHAILKPFMLRRVKKDVEKEMGKKFEHKLLCTMTSHQTKLYNALKESLSLKGIFQSMENRGLLNLVMQLRKVCNHPELFQRRQFTSSYIFHRKVVKG